MDVAPGDVTPRKPHGPVAALSCRWAVARGLLKRQSQLRVRGGDQVGGFFNDTLIAYDTTDLDYPVDLATASSTGTSSPRVSLSAGKQPR